jgi:hypothetical protein
VRRPISTRDRRPVGRQPASWFSRNGSPPLPPILDEPTRGVDVGAKAEIRAVGRLAAEGTGVL